MNDVTEWLAQSARCRRLAMVTTDQRARDAMLALAAEMDAKVAEAQADVPESPKPPREPSRRDG